MWFYIVVLIIFLLAWGFIMLLPDTTRSGYKPPKPDDDSWRRNDRKGKGCGGTGNNCQIRKKNGRFG